MDESLESFKKADAASYDPLTDSFDRFTRMLTTPLAERMVTMARLTGSERIVDIGTGTGVVALTAAAHPGFAGRILGIDLSQGMLHTAWEKIRAANLGETIELRSQDAEHLEIEADSTDLVLSLYALFHFPRSDRALAEMFRILRPGGRLVIAVGSAPPWNLKGILHRIGRIPDAIAMATGRMALAPRFLDEMVKERLPEPPAPVAESGTGGKRPVRKASLVELIREAGFTEVRDDWHGHYVDFSSAEDFWEIQRTFSTPARKRITAAPEPEVAKLKRSFLERCEKVLRRKGRLRFHAAAQFAIGTKPARG